MDDPDSPDFNPDAYERGTIAAFAGEEPALTLASLARALDELKDARRKSRRDGNFPRVQSRRIKLEDQLEPLGLGVAWRDDDECFVVYSFGSIKDGVA